jgi:hypothetical protein
MKLRILFSVFLTMLLFGVNAQVTTVGIIGTATPGMWDFDTDMVQHPDSAHLWTLTIDLVDGLAKFRANDLWDVNWGSEDFPIGVGTQGGADIPIPAGTYDITFNSNTGEYYFNGGVSDVGIIGDATPFGWDADVNLVQSDTDTNEYHVTLDLVAGGAKFRANDAWDINWGSLDFPTGVGVQNGDNIPIPQSGKYAITFNRSTGAYHFEALIAITAVGIIGDATPGGWATVTPMAGSGDVWSLSTDLVDGGLQFVGNDGEVIWGALDFPSGIATEDGDTIPVTGGTWLVEFNSATGEYSFNIFEIFETVGLIGDATPGGWDVDTDMERHPFDSSSWSVRVILTDGEAKFRANHAWDVNWGAPDFPTGVATREGVNIPITAGEYVVTFNSISGEYHFQELIVYDRVGLVGAGTPLASWDVDFFLTKSAEDENIWTLASIDLNGEVKFRADSMWTVNWGANTFPEGIGFQEGPNIPVPAGTYGITFNSATGEYVFGEPLVSTKDILDPSVVSVFPNPASESLYVDLSAVTTNGTANFNIYDMQGKLVSTNKLEVAERVELNVSSLQDGYYTLQITTDKYVIGKKFVIVK